MKNLIGQYIFTLFLILLCSILLTSFVREHGKDYFLARDTYRPEKNDLRKNAGRWLCAVETGNERKAIAAAKALVPSSDIPELPELSFLKAVRVVEMGSKVLTDDFNKKDFLYWRDCLRMMQLAEKLKAENKNTPVLIFEFVKNYVPKETGSEDILVSGILHKKEMAEADRLRLFSALAKQAGYESKIIAAPQGAGETVFLCELRKNNDTTVSADFRNGILYDKPLQELLHSPPSALAGKLVKEKLIYIQPSELFDFRLANQKLAGILAESGLKNIPVFGENPEAVINSYKQKHLTDKESPFNYWNISLLSAKALFVK